MARKANGASAVRRLHRGLGAVGAVFLLLMAVSGILLNHSDSLGLATRDVSSPMLLDWYGLEGPERITSFEAGDDWVSYAGSGAYLNGEPVAALEGGLGAVRVGLLLVAAGSRELLLLDGQGRLVERIPWNRPGAIEAIGLHEGSAVVRTTGQAWLADSDLVAWRRMEESPGAIGWSVAGTPPPWIHDSVTRAYRGGGLSLQRVLLDAHSGRLFGPAGTWAYDLLGLLVGVLAISGLALLARTGVNGRRKKRR